MVPSGITTTGWPAVEQKCREFGDQFDEWQRGAGQLILAKRDDGSYAATVGGVTLSIPRQVAKTFLVGRIVFALCTLFPGLRVLWTAHRSRTATNTFKNLEGYSQRAAVAPYVDSVRKSNGEQEILFTNGSIIMFGARESGFGRGFDEVDVEVFDEAQILGERALEDMVAATNQSRHPHGALLFFMGTPPRPVDPGDAFTARRRDALGYKPDHVGFGPPVVGDEQLYIECSADQGADPDDRKQWAIANPSFPHRTPVRSMLRLRRNLPSDDSWLREGLGVWDAEVADHPIDPDVWAGLEEPPTGARPKPVVFCLSTNRNSRWTYIGLAGSRTDDKVHVQVLKSNRGTAWVVEEAKRLKAEYRPLGFVVKRTDPAASLVPDLEAAGVEVTTLSAVDVAAGAQLLVDGVRQDSIRHAGGHLLTLSVAAARRKVMSGSFVFAGPADDSIDVAPLEAVANALFGLKTLKPKKRSGAVRGHP